MEFRANYTLTDDDIAIVDLHGPVDVATAPVPRDLLTRLIDEGHHWLVLQMEEVDFIDSVGLGVIIGVVRRLRPHHGALAAAAPSAQTRRVVEITQLVRVLPLYDDTEGALEAVRRRRAAGIQ
ncbi:STAS domain-containing protein [Actinomadura sp. DC4]|uniref:STAS domain-containing protein n=1 Tax=Actinomadura sp. DC4 TaxID=3055069 RepID=UPI0025B22555|nr:STAS domain-containing protein [Actinomadura sp. DC4]MDN3357243.1 STAS domain-containing protein [Actinomadura sp. DC4]